MNTDECIFCNVDSQEVFLKNDLCIARFDKYPVSPGHILIIPCRHTPDYFALTRDERLAIDDLLNLAKVRLDEEYKPDGYNIGVNVGISSGQTVMHVHVHLIPRYFGDVTEPKGGVRGVIPHMQSY